MAPMRTTPYKQDYFFTPPPARLTLFPPSTTSTSTTTAATTAFEDKTLDPPSTRQPSLRDVIDIEWDVRPAVARDYQEAFYDMHIKFFGLFEFRIWMLLAAGAALVTTMIIITCCIIRLRIPRSRREIEILAARRRERMHRARRKKEKEKAVNDERSPAIVMNAAVQRLPSMKRPNRTDSKNEKDGKKVVRKKNRD
ncbi:hypothetical protein PRIPAC_70661 [Pristionchus pacificus]|uniref:Uncharacterized protein n=1 Tax=Pristionchus pacificus TaxID=54126 RepID=A0A2A6C5B6_PRIPA|nr:hypothetical protein PRIPAC_70661 [Pristionchus pacificus]|eukprot:PDM73364.1 hypothetical protein PRIPAC_40720 [Pristionchus pacificus]